MEGQALNISIIISRDSNVVSNRLVSQSTNFLDAPSAFAFEVALMDWISYMPLADDPATWKPPERLVEVITPYDDATMLAAKLPSIIHPRDGNLFPDEDREYIASGAEHRPYDQEAVA